MNGSTCHMYISKPKTPEELYQFFIKGIPLKPIEQGFGYKYRRKGWNISIYRVNTPNKELIQLKFLTAISAYHPDWILESHKYDDFK